jgi:hypothetical protein
MPFVVFYPATVWAGVVAKPSFTYDLPPESRSITKDRIYFIMEENDVKKEIFNGANY